VTLHKGAAAAARLVPAIQGWRFFIFVFISLPGLDLPDQGFANRDGK
jgi:hypothetical protein